MEEQRIFVDVAAYRLHCLSRVETVKDGIRELVPVHHLLSVFFRVNGKRHNLAIYFLEPLDVILKVSQLLIAVVSPLSSVKQHNTPTPGEVRGDRHLTTSDHRGDDRCKSLVVFESHLLPPVL